jgi:hypothetical protein
MYRVCVKQMRKVRNIVVVNMEETDYVENLKYRSSFSEVNRPRHDVDRSPASTVEVESEWSCTSAPSMCLHGLDRNSFTFSFTDDLKQSS